jgi:hypothetical protein
MGKNDSLAPRSLRTWWIWTVIGNFTGFGILLTCWATNSSTLVALGFVVVVVSPGVQSAQAACTPLKEQSQCSDRAHGEDLMPLLTSITIGIGRSRPQVRGG